MEVLDQPVTLSFTLSSTLSSTSIDQVYDKVNDEVGLIDRIRVTICIAALIGLRAQPIPREPSLSLVRRIY